MAQHVLVMWIRDVFPAPLVLACGGETRLEHSIKKFKPHFIIAFFFQARVSGTLHSMYQTSPFEDKTSGQQQLTHVCGMPEYQHKSAEVC